MTIGSTEWWESESLFGTYGVVDTSLRLLELGSITRRKATELIHYGMAMQWSHIPDMGYRPSAPWDELDWGEGKEAKP